MAGYVKYSGTSLRELSSKLRNYDIEMQGFIEQIVLVARGLITERLEVYLGTGAEHFSVSIRPNGIFGYTITVATKDEVGVFLFEGVQPHVITGVAMPIGGGNFADIVQHPGFDSKSELIERAVNEGFYAAWGLMING